MATPPPSPARPAIAWSAALGALAALLLGALLFRLVFLGRTQSFDTMLYARGLWGMARGDFFNPVLGVPTLALHAHLLALPLAPLTRVLPSAAVLVLAQSVSLGVTFFLVLRDARRSLPSGWAVGAGVLILSSPLVLNPFFFDPRPDLLGVPLVAAALLRAAWRGGFDGRAVLLLAIGAMAREEFALAGAAALVLAPPSAAPKLWNLRRRLVGGAALAGYFAAYTFALRPWLGGSDLSMTLHLRGGDGTPMSLLASKLDVLAAIALTAGALPWLGWRWLGGALPGVLFLLVTRWQVEDQLRFHYAMLAAPGLLAATAVALVRVARLATVPRAAVLVVAALLAGASYARWSAAPGGRRFARFNFEMAAPDGGLAIRRGPNTRAAHAALARIPRTHGIAVPWQLGAPLADRPFVWALPTLLEHLARTQQVPSAVTTVALLGDETLRAGRVLVAVHGFKLAGLPDGPITLLTRDPRLQDVPWDSLSALGRPPRCDPPEVTWPAAGLVLCAMGPVAGHPRALVFREHEAATDAARRSLHLIATGTQWLANGLVDLADLPAGRSTRLSSEPLPAGQTPPPDPILLDALGREIRRAPAAAAR